LFIFTFSIPIPIPDVGFSVESVARQALSSFEPVTLRIQSEGEPLS
jgi:hypothetical protein